jgi:hypothetical protein
MQFSDCADGATNYGKMAFETMKETVDSYRRLIATYFTLFCSITLLLCIMRTTLYGMLYIEADESDESGENWVKFCHGSKDVKVKDLTAVPLLTPLSFVSSVDGEEGTYQCPFSDSISCTRLLVVIGLLCVVSIRSLSSFTCTMVPTQRRIEDICMLAGTGVLFILYVLDGVLVSNGHEYCRRVVKHVLEAASTDGYQIEVTCNYDAYLEMLRFEMAACVSICVFAWITHDISSHYVEVKK